MCNQPFKILDHLPAYGDMYIPVTDDGSDYFSEGFVVKFTQSDSTTWVANFKPGWTGYSHIHAFSNDRLLVIANGLAYLMDPDETLPICTFGLSITTSIHYKQDQIIVSDDTTIELVDQTGIVWRSPRLSWDGIKEVQITNDLLTGLSFDPTSATEWSSFSIDLKTKNIVGDTFESFLQSEISKSAWWQFWK